VARSELALLATVLAAVTTVAAVGLLTWWAYHTATGPTGLRDPDVDPALELRDRLVWLAALGAAAVLGALLAVVRLPARRLLVSWPVIALAVVGAVGVAASAAWVDPAIGLGPGNVLLALVLGPLLVAALGPVPPRALRFLWAPVVVVGGALYLPALWQNPRGLYDAMHASRGIDEMLGPVAGNLPLADYVPQYGGVLGLPLAPLRPWVAQHPAAWVMAYLSVLAVLTVVGLCVAAALMLPPGRRVLAPVVVVPALVMKPSAPEALIPAGLQRLYQVIPDRSLLPVLVGVALLLAATRPRGWARWLAVGAAAGLAALHNFESGVPAVAAALVVVVALRPGWRALAALVGGLGGVVAAYLVLVWASGGTVKAEYWVAFSAEFASGFARLPMPPYGNHVLLLFVLVAGVASAFPALWRGTPRAPVAAVGGLFFGAWGLMMFPYYVGRSSSMGQLQFFLIPAGVVAVWLLVVTAPVLLARRPSPRLAFAALLGVLPAAVLASAVLGAPSPEMQAKRLMGGFSPVSDFRSTAWARSPVVDEKRAAEIREVADTARPPVGVYYTSGNVVALRTGLPNASVVAVPQELLPRRPWSQNPKADTGNAAFRRMQCEALSRSALNSVVAEQRIAGALDGCAGFSRGPASRGLVVVTRDSR
jgi:hypothetical protein